MAVNPQNSLTYKQLLDQFRSWVKSNCNNVDSYKSTVPASLKEGFSQSYTYTESNKTKRATFSINSWDVMPVVTSSTIDSQITTFFTDRNIVQRQNDYVTTSGVINFMHNIAIFCNARLYLVASQYCPNAILMYNSANVQAFEALDNLSDVFTKQSEEPVRAVDFITIAQAFSGSIVNFAKEKYIIYRLTLS